MVHMFSEIMEVNMSAQHIGHFKMDEEKHDRTSKCVLSFANYGVSGCLVVLSVVCYCFYYSKLYLISDLYATVGI